MVAAKRLEAFKGKAPLLAAFAPPSLSHPPGGRGDGKALGSAGGGKVSYVRVCGGGTLSYVGE